MTRRKRRPASNMAEVARRAGVSLSTVSRALSGSPLISEETRNLVRKAAERLDYQVDAAGSSLRTGLTRTIGVVIPLSHAADQSFSDPFFLEILGALADELSACGYSMLLNKVTEDPAIWMDSIARGRRADGVIVVGQSLHHESLNRMADTGLPMVVWGGRLAGQRYVTVGSDNEAGGHDATAHLLSQGCRCIAFLGDVAAPEVTARREGYLRALRAAGIARTPQLEIAVRFGSDTAYHAVAALLDAGTRFDGVVACSDVFAINAMRALAERDCKVPTDVAIVGFDDIPFAAFTTPPLTTIRQNCRVGARLLVDNLLRMLRGEVGVTEVIATELVVRASSLRAHYRALPSIRGPRRSESATARGKKSRTG
ncbi:MAG: LacI family DNA-binding transcriptional regulator [Pseudomonadota bacterium]